MREPWEHFHVEVEEIEEGEGGGIFSRLRIAARGRGSGAEVDLRFWSVSWFEDGLVTRRRVFWTPEEARTAAGL
jgi:hypothetical protein